MTSIQCYYSGVIK